MTKSTVRGELKLSPPTHNEYKAHTNRLLAAPARAFCSSFSTALQPHCYTEHKSTATHKDVSLRQMPAVQRGKKVFCLCSCCPSRAEPEGALASGRSPEGILAVGTM